MSYRLGASALLSLFTLTLGTAGAATLRIRAAATSSWAPTATQGLKLVSATDFGAVPAAMPMQIVVGLGANRSAIDAAIRNAYAPGSSAYHKFLTPAQFTAAFAPSQTQASAVASYLVEAGLTNVSIAPNRMLVFASGNAATVDRAFNTQIHAFTQFGSPIFANVSPAQVPAALGGTVLSVLGLDNVQMHTFNKRSHRARTSRKRDVSPCLNPGSVCALNTYFPTDLALAYDGASSPIASNTAIAIFTEGDLTQPKADLAQALLADHQAPVAVREVDVLGAATDVAGSGEWDIDSQSSTGMAGGVKSLTFYNGTSLANASITATFNRFATDDSAPLANASFGGCEALSYATGAMATDDLILAETVLQGQSVFVSSGDGGSQCSVAVNPGAPVGLPSVEYPASSPYATAVGGTSLLTNSADGTYYGEIAWINGGGGVSLFENAAPWQYAGIQLAAGGKRLVPDLANDADPNVSGMNTVVSGAYSGYGGTSLASPMTMGVFARLMSRHGNSLGQAAASLYADYNAQTGNSLGLLPSTNVPAGVTQPYGGFNDVLTGSNTLYQSTPGYDLTTGIGTLDIAKIIRDYGN